MNDEIAQHLERDRKTWLDIERIAKRDKLKNLENTAHGEAESDKALLKKMGKNVY